MQEPRKCGLCQLAPREDDPMGAIRVLPADGLPADKGPGGVFHACKDCIDKYKPAIAARLMQTPAIGSDGQPVLDAAGNLVMTITDPAQAVGSMLL